jgi:hypothetical protein
MSIGRPFDRDLVADRYRILEPLDEEGRVLKVRDQRRHRTVVLEWLGTTPVSGPGASVAFKRQAEALGRLEHPNIVALLDAGDDRGLPFVVRAFAEGTDLARIVRDRGPLALGQAIDILIQAARGLEIAHALGILHQDLRPSKLILDTDGNVRVIGLGLAHLTGPSDSDAGRTEERQTGDRTDEASGDFMAPELAEDHRPSDARADIYSLGCILYFLFTGRRPFIGATSLDRATAHREQPAPALRAMRPDVPSALEELYRQMMAKQPSDRPASMTEVRVRLESSRTGSAEVPLPSTTAPREGRRSSRGRTAPRDRLDAPISAVRDEAGGTPIGPEFSLEGLDIEVRPRAAPADTPRPATRRAIGVPSAASGRPEANGSFALRVGRPAILIGLIGAAAVGAVVLRALVSSGGKDRPAGPPERATRGSPAPTREIGQDEAENPAPSPGPAWTSRTIFDGSGPNGWMLTNRRPLPRKQIQPEGLNPHGSGSYLVVYEEKLGDFILDFDYKLTRGCNTGVFLRVADLDDPVNTGLEISLQDSDGTGNEDPGAISGLVSPSLNAQRPAGQWNHMTITARGPVIAVALNGKDVSRIELDEWTVPGRRPDGSRHKFNDVAFARARRVGYLGFQDLTGDCWIRNIVLKVPASS